VVFLVIIGLYKAGDFRGGNLQAVKFEVSLRQYQHVTHRPPPESFSPPLEFEVYHTVRFLFHGSIPLCFDPRALKMASEAPKDLPVRPTAEAQAKNASEAAAAPPKDANANSKKAPSPDVLPEVMIKRNQLFEELWLQHLEDTKNRPHPEITVTLDIGDGNPSSSIPGKAYETTPGSFLRDVPKELSANIVIAKVDGELWDLNRPLEKDCQVLLMPFSNPEAREVFWHSSAHCLGEACECEYGCLLSHGPPTPQGFFYDMAMPDGYVLHQR
jgi:threonyl-tRNA synthetase